MKYAVVRISGHQYKVSEKDEILVDRLVDLPRGKAGTKVEPEVLLVVSDDNVSVGKPKVSGAKVTVKVLGEEKGEKIDVRKYKAKSRYRKHIGFRPQYTRLLIEKISS